MQPEQQPTDQNRPSPNQPQPRQTFGPNPALAPNPQFKSTVAASPAVQPTATPVPKQGLSKTVIIVAVIVVILLLTGSVILAVTAGKPATKKTAQNTTNASQAAGPAPATSLSIQQSSDALSQDLSNLNDSQDFPANALSDTTLQIN